MIRILYASCHSILEYDEVSLLHQLGYEVFSPGAYVCPLNPGDSTLRPGIPGLVYDPDILEQFHKICAAHPTEDAKDHLTKEFVDNFDIVLIMHLPRWVVNNWEVIKHKRVIWRTIGQSITSVEQQLKPYRDQGMEIIRYSPMEVNIPGFIGQDALIRFYKDPEVYKDWKGTNRRVITFGQHMQSRDQACNYRFFEEVTRPYSRHLYGPGNEGHPWSTGKVSHETLIQEMQMNRVYFYTGTHPASYTLNFIEAWMTGIPIVAIGPQHGNASYFHNHNLYEIPHLVTSHSDGFVSDSIQELREYISMLLSNDTAAQLISKKGRKQAIRHFGKDMISAAWKKYLDEGGK